MTKPHKKRQKQTRQPSPPQLPIKSSSALDISTATSTPPTQDNAPPGGKIRQAGQRLFGSALDYALQHIWELLFVSLGGPIVTALGAILLYVRTGQAVWLLPWVTHLLAFWAGMFLLVGSVLILAWRKSRKEQRERAAIDRAKLLRFASDKKGFVDFFADKERAEAQLAKVLQPITKEIVGVGKVSKKYTARITRTASFVARQKLASEVASLFQEHAEKMNDQLAIFKDLDDVLSEANPACVDWLNAENREHAVMLSMQRSAASALLDSMEIALPSLEGLRDASLAQLGISQDLNSSINRLVFVLDDMLAAFRRSRERWRALIAQIDHKLPIGTIPQ